VGVSGWRVPGTNSRSRKVSYCCQHIYLFFENTCLQFTVIRVRKALTSQLHSLRQELGPKEEKLLESTERLDEVEREYEHALFAISEKEQNLSRKGESLHLLQKQLGDLRTICHQKDATLRRVAKMFEEYKYTIQQNSMKKSLHLGGLPSYNHTKKELPPLPSLTKSSNNANATSGIGGGFGAAANALAFPSESSIALLNDSPSLLLAAEMNQNGDGLGQGFDTGNNLSMNKLIYNKFHQNGPPTEKVEIIVRNHFVEDVLKKLGDVLKPYYQLSRDGDITTRDETEADFEERERQVQLLHNSIDGLKTNLQHTQLVANAKVRNHVTDNMHLLKEVNELRHDVRQLSLENQRLTANKRFVDRKRSERLVTLERAQTMDSFDEFSSPGKSPLRPSSPFDSTKKLSTSMPTKQSSISQSMPSLDYGRGKVIPGGGSSKSFSNPMATTAQTGLGAAATMSAILEGSVVSDASDSKSFVPSLNFKDKPVSLVNDGEFSDDLLSPDQRPQPSYEQYAALPLSSNRSGGGRSIESKLDDIFAANQELIASNNNVKKQQLQQSAKGYNSYLSESSNKSSSTIAQLLKSYQDVSSVTEKRPGSRSETGKQKIKTTTATLASSTASIPGGFSNPTALGQAVKQKKGTAALGQRLVTLPDMPSSSQQLRK
jgi:hypothetical protein